MKLDLLYCCRMVDESDSFEIVPEFLSALEMEFSTWEDRENRRTIQTVYAETEEDAIEQFDELVDPFIIEPFDEILCEEMPLSVEN